MRRHGRGGEARRGTRRFEPTIRGVRAYHSGMSTFGAIPEGSHLQELFDASPDRKVHTSAAAEVAFLTGLVALFAAPFTAVQALSLVVGTVAVLFSVVGTATTSRPDVAGRALVPAGLFFGLAAVVLVGLRYLGLDTAFGDGFVPTMGEWLASLNVWLRMP